MERGMFLRNVLQRWRGGPVDTAAVGREGANACAAPSSLLTEVLVDGEDFADLARVLHRDLPTVMRAIVTAQPPTLTALVTALEAEPAFEPKRSAPSRAAAPNAPSCGGGRAVGWGRWTRARGGARVHREAIATASGPATS
jgi:hypothetical protein